MKFYALSGRFLAVKLQWRSFAKFHKKRNTFFITIDTILLLLILLLFYLLWFVAWRILNKKNWGELQGIFNPICKWPGTRRLLANSRNKRRDADVMKSNPQMTYHLKVICKPIFRKNDISRVFAAGSVDFGKLKTYCTYDLQRKVFWVYLFLSRGARRILP